MNTRMGNRCTGDIIEKVLACLFLCGCGLPPVAGLSDETVMPKWYAGGVMFLVLTVFAVSVRGHGSMGRSLGTGAAVACVMEYACVATEIVRHGGIPEMGVRGTFDNPSGLALFICTLVPLSVWRMNGFGRFRMNRENRGTFVTGISFVACASAVLLLSKSRTGLVCAGCFLLLSLWRTLRMGRIWKITIMCSIVFAIAGFCLCRKTDSTSGRAFILKTTWRLIKEKPVCGHGRGGFHREYMDRQGRYFAAHPDSGYAVLADDIRHPLNEFALSWCEYGIAGVGILCALFVLPLVAYRRSRDRSLKTWLPSLAAVFLFSCFSYPFHYPLSWLVMLSCTVQAAGTFGFMRPTGRFLHHRLVSAGILTVCAASLLLVLNEFRYEREWGRLAARAAGGHPRSTLERYGALYPHYSSSPYFLYNYSAVSYSAGRFDKALQLAEECGSLWSGYNLELLLGDINRRMGIYGEAVVHYRRAYDMCPSRFAPLAGIMYVYTECRQTDEAVHTARIIRDKEVKVESAVVRRIKKEAETLLENNNFFN